MLAIPEEVKQLYQKDSIPKKLIVNFYPIGTYRIHPMASLFPSSTLYPGSKGVPELTLSGKQILGESMTITEGLFSGDTIDFRSCFSAKCTLTVLDVKEDVYHYDIEVIQEIGGYKVPLFTGTVDAAKRRDNRVMIVAYDYLYYNYGEDMSGWYNGLSFPMTVKEFRLALYDVCDIPFEEVSLVNDGMSLGKVELDGPVTGRDFLSMIGELNGVFVHVSRANALTYVMLQSIAYLYPAKDLYPQKIYPGIQTGISIVEQIRSYISCEYEQYKTKDIDRVVSEGTYALSSGTGTNAYVMKDNLLFESITEAERQTALDNLYLMIRGLPYVPHRTEIQGRPYVEVGDVINIRAGKTFDSYVFTRTLKGVSALRDSYEAEGEEYHNAAYEV